MQNGLGVVFAIGWGVFLYLQNKQKVKTEEHLEAKLTSEQSAVTELKQEVCLCGNHIQDANMSTEWQ